MAYYKTYILQDGDNLQMIAQIELGSVDKWRDIVDINDLVYPYIVKTSQEKLDNPEHLITYGDAVKLPVANSITDLVIDDFNKVDQQYIYDTALGVDIAMEIQSELGLDDQIAYVKENSSTGGLIAFGGISNLQQSLTMRLLTRQGSLLRHPNYGTKLLDYIGETVNSDNLSLAQDEIIRTCKTDERVSAVKITDYVVQQGNDMCFTVEITPINADKAFNIFITRAQDGTIKVR